MIEAASASRRAHGAACLLYILLGTCCTLCHALSLLSHSLMAFAYWQASLRSWSLTRIMSWKPVPCSRSNCHNTTRSSILQIPTHTHTYSSCCCVQELGCADIFMQYFLSSYHKSDFTTIGQRNLARSVSLLYILLTCNQRDEAFCLEFRTSCSAVGVGVACSLCCCCCCCCCLL